MPRVPGALFVSDVHLSPGEPAVTEAFFSFLEGPAREADRLCLLGDIFDIWIGDDEPSPLHDEFAARVRALADGGAEVSFTAGNHDFLVGEDFARRCGMALLPDEAAVRIGGNDILLLHGDTLCTDDLPYMKWREVSRRPRTVRDFLAMPVDARRAEVGRMLQAGGQGAPTKPTVSDAAVADTFGRHGCGMMVHGHTHSAGIHRGRWGGSARVRYVLPPWSKGRAGYLRVEADGIAFNRWRAP